MTEGWSRFSVFHFPSRADLYLNLRHCSPILVIDSYLSSRCAIPSAVCFVRQLQRWCAHCGCESLRHSGNSARQRGREQVCLFVSILFMCVCVCGFAILISIFCSSLCYCRGTSVYLVNKRIDMIPSLLSTGIAYIY